MKREVWGSAKKGFEGRRILCNQFRIRIKRKIEHINKSKFRGKALKQSKPWATTTRAMQLVLD